MLFFFSLSIDLPLSAYRELQAHQYLCNEQYIVHYKNYYWEMGGTLVLVLERMICDLGTLLEHRLHILPEPIIRRILYMVLQGISIMHNHGLFHRDLKPQNILINSLGICKIGDLGLTRPYKRKTIAYEGINSINKHKDSTVVPDLSFEYTNQISSRWYRAPEILYGSKYYGPAIDIWGIGCIAVELYTGKPFIPGTSDIEQLARTFKIRGTPTPLTWKNIELLPDYDKIQFNKADPIPLSTIVPRACNEGIDLLDKLLTLDPEQRITAKEALTHPYFTSEKLSMASDEEMVYIIEEIKSTLHTIHTKPIENQRIGSLITFDPSLASSSHPSTSFPSKGNRLIPPSTILEESENNL